MPTPIIILRWIALLPAALIAGWLGYFLMAYAWNLSLSMQGIDLTDFKVRVCHFAASGLAMGAGFVYGGAYVAPSHKTHTAIVLAMIAGLFFGSTLTLVFLVGTEDYWGLWQGLCLLLGAGVSAIAIAIEGFRNPLV